MLDLRSWDYGHGQAAIQVVKGKHFNLVERLWNGRRQIWWSIPATTAYEGVVESVLDSMVRDEEHLHQSHLGRIGC